MTTLAKTLLASGAAALLMGLGAAAPAQAGGKHGHHHHGHHHHHFGHHHGYGPSIYIGGGYGGCGYYKRMWWRTGSYYWKAKYYDCID